MKILHQGCGAGTRDLEIPNILRLFVGEASASSRTLTMLESDIDDMSPEQAGYALEALQAEGALDVTFSSVQMKKNRPGLRINVLCEPGQKDALLEIFFAETSTFGIREYVVQRHELDRETIEVETTFGKVKVKQGTRDGKTIKQVPEYEDCVQHAREHHVTWREVYEAALKKCS